MPPKIIAKETSTDMVVREASNVTLVCKATGYPEPYVMWRREDGTNINYNGESGKFIIFIILIMLKKIIFLMCLFNIFVEFTNGNTWF